MTKGDLIEFLQPFTDDIKIFLEADMGLIERAGPPRYALARKHKDHVATVEPTPVWYQAVESNSIEPGEGIVIL